MEATRNRRVDHLLGDIIVGIAEPLDEHAVSQIHGLLHRRVV